MSNTDKLQWIVMAAIFAYAAIGFSFHEHKRDDK